MTDILEGNQRLAEGVEHAPEPPAALQTAGSDAALTFRLLKEVGGAVFHGIGIGGISNALSCLYNVHRHHEIVEESIVGHVTTERGVHGVELTGGAHGRE